MCEFSRQYGFWRPYVQKVIDRYLKYGDLHNGFANLFLSDFLRSSSVRSGLPFPGMTFYLL
jgi:hypothetical protein